VPNTVTADEILKAIRFRHNKAAIVSEVVVTDEFEMAIARRYWADRHPRYTARELARYAEKGEVVADFVPEGWVMNDSKLIRRIDGLMLEGGKYTAIEIKVSRADFKRDTEEKRRMWRSITHRFVYAVPKGLVDPSELPPYAGLWEYDPTAHYSSQIASAKRAATNKQCEPMPQQVVTAMFYRSARAEQAKVGRARRTRTR
jgi:hypothetical protein